VIGDIAESPGDRNLQEETDGGQGVAGEASETETLDNGRRVGIKSTLRTVIGKGDDDVDPETPVGELKKNVSDRK
jgi:hypothetical protein